MLISIVCKAYLIALQLGSMVSFHDPRFTLTQEYIIIARSSNPISRSLIAAEHKAIESERA